jgi:hypothetical protein
VTGTQELVLLFVVLPFVVVVPVVAFVSWRWRNTPAPPRTSVILAEGEPGDAEVLSVRQLGGPLEVRPMVRFEVRVRTSSAPEPFDLEIVQALPRGSAGAVRPGDVLDVRVMADHSAGAVVWGQAL